MVSMGQKDVMIRKKFSIILFTMKYVLHQKNMVCYQVKYHSIQKQIVMLIVNIMLVILLFEYYLAIPPIPTPRSTDTSSAIPFLIKFLLRVEVRPLQVEAEAEAERIGMFYFC